MAALVAEITGMPAPRYFLPMALARFLAPLGGMYARFTGRRTLFTPSALHALAHSNRHISHARATLAAVEAHRINRVRLALRLNRLPHEIDAAPLRDIEETSEMSAMQVASLFGSLELRDAFTGQLDAALNHAEGFGQRLQGLGDATRDFGANLTALTAPITAFGLTGSRAVSDFQDVIAEIGVRAGLTAEEIEEVRRVSIAYGNDPSLRATAASSADALLELLTSGQNLEEALGTSYGWVEFSFSTAPSLSGSATYWIVLETADSASESDYVVWSAESKDAVFDLLDEDTVYDEPVDIGSWSLEESKIACRFDDGSGAHADTQTTFKNLHTATLDITCEVRLR